MSANLVYTLLIVLGIVISPAPIVCQNPFMQLYDVPREFLITATSTEAASCPAPGVSTTIDPAYSVNFTYTSTSACLQPYETICRAPSGAVRCNNRDALVKTTARSSEALYPALSTKGTGEIQQCVSEGEYQHADANAVLVAQSLVSFFVVIICAILTLIRTWQHSSLFVRLWFLFMMIICIILLPSFYYLNALIGVGAAMLAVIMFSTRNTTAVAIGITACMSAVLWFTFDSGLGFLTHTAHLRVPAAADPAIPLYENLCDAYYRFSYHVPLPVLQDNTNPLRITESACLRGWLANELFFSVFLIISLIIMAVAGAHSLTQGHVESNPESA